jgi:hypothetical protein
MTENKKRTEEDQLGTAVELAADKEGKSLPDQMGVASGQGRLCLTHPANPQEFVEELKRRINFPVNVMSSRQLEARRRVDLEMEAWHWKRPKKLPE